MTKTRSTNRITARKTGLLPALLGVFCALALFFVPLRAGAQPAQFTVHFPFDSADFTRDYLENASTLDALDAMIGSGALGTDFTAQIVSFSSPEGSYSYNKRLSLRRAQAMESYLLSNYPALEGRLTVSAGAESWDDFRSYVVNDSALSGSQRAELLSIVDGDGTPDAKEKALKAHPVYRSIYASWFGRLRYAAIVLTPGTRAGEAPASGSGRRPYTVFYELGSTRVNDGFARNDESLREIEALLGGTSQDNIVALQIESGASPEGPVALNERIARQRGEALRDRILRAHPELKGKISLRSKGEAWDELRAAAVQSDRLSPESRSLLLEIIDSGDSPEKKESRMRNLKDYAVVRDLYTAARFATLKATLKTPVPELPELEEPEIADEEIETPEFGVLDTALSVAAEPKTRRPLPLFAISTNVLLDAAITPNFAVEVPIGNKWSVYGEYTFPWWIARDNSKAYQMLKWDLGARRWLSSHDSADRMDVLTGHFVGVDLTGGYYDFEPGGRGWQGEFAGISAEYGYAWRLGRNWRLDAFVDFGVIRSGKIGNFGQNIRYYEPDVTDAHLVYKQDMAVTLYPVTKAGVSFKYIFTKKSAK